MMVTLSTLVLCILSFSGGTATPLTLPPLAPFDSNFNNILFADSSSLSCPSGYVQPANSNWDKCYKVSTTYKSRKDALAECKMNNGTLSSPRDAYANAYLYSLASKVGATSLWLGIQCSSEVKTCINDNESRFNYNNFYPGQPTAKDICVYMSSVGRDSQSWSTFTCQQRFQFACEVASNANVPSNSTVAPPTKTTKNPLLRCPANYLEFKGICYYKINYSYVPVTREEVAKQCRTVPGGKIVSIPSKEVNDYLISMPSQCPLAYAVNIGLRCTNIKYNGDTSSCAWDDGTPFSYNGFKTGMPLMNSTCTYLRNGLWTNDWPCDTRLSCGACQAPLS